MRVYRMFHEGTDEKTYYGTRAELHAAAKGKPKTTWPDLYLDEFEVKTDKEGVLRMLNDDPDMDPIQGFTLTARGGLELEGPR